MIHPSYYELMDKINEENKKDNAPEITSRYSLVLATSKRARQLTDGARSGVENDSPKFLSVAIDEFYQGIVKIVGYKPAESPFEELSGEPVGETPETYADDPDAAAVVEDDQ